jgi:hypothetical protein
MGIERRNLRERFHEDCLPGLAQSIVSRFRQGEVVEFPNHYELDEVKGKFGGCWGTTRHRASVSAIAT